MPALAGHDRELRTLATFDPFEILPFHGYINSETGKRELHNSLAHFYHHQRLAGSSDGIRQYLASIDDPDLFRIEVEGVGYETTADDWVTNETSCLKAGLYMQAVDQIEVYGELLQSASNLSVVNCSFATTIADALSSFICSLGANEDVLKVAFIGDAPMTFAVDCFKVIFDRRLPDALFALEGEDLSQVISNLARKLYVPLSLIPCGLEPNAAAENIGRRCTHAFHFQGVSSSQNANDVAEALLELGKVVTPISVDHAKAG